MTPLDVLIQALADTQAIVRNLRQQLDTVTAERDQLAAEDAPDAAT